MVSSDIDDDRDLGWDPPADLQMHSSVAIPLDMDFFVEPPPEIGDLLSAHSTLKKSKEPMGAMSRMIIAFVVAIGIWLGFWLLLKAMDPNDEITGHVLGLIVGLLGLAIVYAVTGFKHVCTYVGKKGLARYTIKGSRYADPQEELVEFDQVIDLFTGQTRHYTNGVYTGTQYFFRWDDSKGRKKLNLTGSYRSEKGEPPPQDPFYFGQAGEISWSIYLLDALQKELDEHGSVEFKVNSKDAVRVGVGYMEFCFGSKEQRVDGEELKHISIGGGTFSFKTADAKWYSSKGKFSFDYSRMANARCFLLVLNNLLGVSFN
jgi:hypothetical protein